MHFYYVMKLSNIYFKLIKNLVFDIRVMNNNIFILLIKIAKRI